MSGPIGSSQWMYSSGAGFYSYSIDQSLRFEEDDSAYLTFTPSSDGTDNKKYTFSVWIKLAQGSGDFRTVFSSKNTGSGTGQGHNTYAFGIDDDFEVYTQNGGANPTSPRVYRDRGAWYHFCIVYDTTQTTDTDRVKVYVNGTQQTDYTGTFPGLNSVMASVNTNGQEQRWGRYVSAYTRYFNGYMAEIHMVDGQALSPTDFAEEIGGVWVPKKYADNGTTSHGVNGYHLTFEGTGTATTTQNTTAQTNIGDDQSGNGNNWTVSANFVSSDVVPDSPTNNFATANPLAVNTSSPWTTSEGNLKILTSSNNKNIRGTILMQSGKWYWETRRHNANPGSAAISDGVGIALASGNIEDNPYQSATNWSYYSNNGNKYNNNSGSSYGDSWNTAGDIIGVAFDADNGALWFSKNGTWQNSATASEIAAGTTTNAAYTGLTETEGYVCNWWRTGGTNAEELDLNFGQNPSFNAELTGSDVGTESGDGSALFKYAPPTEFKALTTSNMPDITIGPGQGEQADDYFNTVIWSGDGASSRGITGVGHAPDFVWIKTRNQGNEHSLFDSVRGVAKDLESNSTAAEQTDNQYGYLNSFDSDGFTVIKGSNSNPALVNASGNTYVSWNWKAGGTASSIAVDAYSAGVPSIASSVSAAPDAGFSIVSWTGTGANSTIAHGLSEAPKLIIVKNRDDTSNWPVYSEFIGAANRLYLDLGNNSSGASTLWNSTAATNQVFSVGTSNLSNGSTDGMIAYCFHSVDGFSKVGNYRGNASADGTFVFTGFRPAWVLLKDSNSTSDWQMYDSKRYAFNKTNVTEVLEANESGIETTAINELDLLSNGFKLRSTNTFSNKSSDFIYLAFAEQPFKFANAR